MVRATTSLARRLGLAVIALLALSGATHRTLQARSETQAASASALNLRDSPGRVVTADGETLATSELVLSRDWSGDFCRPSLVNKGARAARIREVVLFSIPHALPAETSLYGESFQMLSQTAGTVGRPVDLGYSELKHYRLPQPADATVSASGLLTLQPPGGDSVLLGFTSARRFIGRFYLRPGRLDIVVDTEGLTLQPGERWSLEELLVTTGPRRPDLLARLATRIAEHHPPLRFPSPPAGWCSWYCFGPKVTATQVLENLDVIAKQIPPLQYVQIDDGYQPAMGDWLETGQVFGGDVQGVLKAIRTRGFQPAIRVAPFIAETGSRLFREHPDWFMRDADGKPLSSNAVTFGGWRRGPWYALDGTHPDAQRRKLLPPTGVAARFADETLRVGVIGASDGTIGRTWRVAVFNWDDTPQTIAVALPGAARIRDVWTGADLGRHATSYTLERMPPHSARLLECERSDR
jgi:alpha-galactosidase